jgi:peptide/nickel transport system substrate-binding protein
VEVWIPASHRGEGPYVAALLRSIGYRARYRDVSLAAFYGPRGPLDRVQAGVTSWFADFPAASNYIGFLFACHGPGNLSGFCDRSIDRRISRARALQATDPYLANRRWAALDRAIVDRAPMVPLVAFKEVDMVSRRVGNYQFNPQWGVLPSQLWVR